MLSSFDPFLLLDGLIPLCPTPGGHSQRQRPPPTAHSGLTGCRLSSRLRLLLQRSQQQYSHPPSATYLMEGLEAFLFFFFFYLVSFCFEWKPALYVCEEVWVGFAPKLGSEKLMGRCFSSRMPQAAYRGEQLGGEGL